MLDSTPFNSFISHFNSRVVVTYFFYVILWNWKLFGYLFDVGHVPSDLYGVDTEYPTVLDYIQSQFSFWFYFVIPVGCTAASLMLIPQLNRFNANYRTKVRVKRENKDKENIHGQLKYSTDDYNRLHLKFEKQKKEYSDSIRRYEEVKKDNIDLSGQVQEKSRELIQQQKLVEVIQREKNTLSNDLSEAKATIETTNIELEEVNNKLKEKLEEFNSFADGASVILERYENAKKDVETFANRYNTLTGDIQKADDLSRVTELKEAFTDDIGKLVIMSLERMVKENTPPWDEESTKS